jgi:hypothetical protein
VSQTCPQLPALQARWPFCTSGHAWAQSPQLSGSVTIAMQAVSHNLVFAGHSKLQLPLSQAGVPPVGAEHGLSQAPQSSGLVAALTSQPFVVLSPSQSRYGSTQTSVHWPSWQVVPGQAVVQLPQ